MQHAVHAFIHLHAGATRPGQSAPKRTHARTHARMQGRSGINYLVWTPDGRRLYSAANNGMLVYWNAQTYTSDNQMQVRGRRGRGGGRKGVQAAETRVGGRRASALMLHAIKHADGWPKLLWAEHEQL